MRCRKAMRVLMRDAGDLPGEVRVHFDECADCCRLSEFLAGLEQAGAGERARDLSAEKIRSTRLQVAEILAGRRTAPAAAPAWGLMRAAAWSLPVLAALAIGVMFFLSRGREAEGLRPAGPVEVARLDAEIDGLAGTLGRDMARFTEQHLAGEPPLPADEAESLRVDMELCALRLVEELAFIPARPLDDSGRLR